MSTFPVNAYTLQVVLTKLVGSYFTNITVVPSEESMTFDITFSKPVGAEMGYVKQQVSKLAVHNTTDPTGLLKSIVDTALKQFETMENKLYGTAEALNDGTSTGYSGLSYQGKEIKYGGIPSGWTWTTTNYDEADLDTPMPTKEPTEAQPLRLKPPTPSPDSPSAAQLWGDEPMPEHLKRGAKPKISSTSTVSMKSLLDQMNEAADKVMEMQPTVMVGNSKMKAAYEKLMNELDYAKKDLKK